VVDATVVAIAVAAARMAAVAVPIAGDAPAADRVSNAAGQVPLGITGVIREGIPVRRAVHSSSPRC